MLHQNTEQLTWVMQKEDTAFIKQINSNTLKKAIAAESKT